MRRLIFWAIVIAAAVAAIWFFTSGNGSDVEDRVETVKDKIQNAGEQIEDLAGDAGHKAQEAVQDVKRSVDDLAH
jgi:hypothetical protein